ncbi:unnamed protein product [Rangifer tarandus platyrhynchus]|uniref:Uncharacterized protein n=1 Tax=Rangifer tarandus platyrhynchus TaxID=3082113 RepID=A0ABN8Z2K9_RANTA|nr:unnamed protein product [Rangifer tarandus platyrhynchus]
MGSVATPGTPLETPEAQPSTRPSARGAESGGRVVSPDPRASGPKRPSGQKIAQLFCSAGPGSSGLSYHPTSPRLDARKPCGAPSFLGARRGAEEAGKLFPRGTGRASPSVRKAATCSRPLETFTHTSIAPSPLAGWAGQGPHLGGHRAPS